MVVTRPCNPASQRRCEGGQGEMKGRLSGYKGEAIDATGFCWHWHHGQSDGPLSHRGRSPIDGPRPAARGHDQPLRPGGTLGIVAKDLHLACELAREVGAPWRNEEGIKGSRHLGIKEKRS